MLTIEINLMGLLVSCLCISRQSFSHTDPNHHHFLKNEKTKKRWWQLGFTMNREATVFDFLMEGAGGTGSYDGRKRFMVSGV